MSTLIVWAFIVVAVLLVGMWLSPTLRDKITTSWGAAGAALAALLAWVLSWFAGAPPELPPM